MECKDCHKLISKDIDGEITLEERDFLIRHLETCDSCRRFESFLKSMTDIHSGIEDQTPPVSLMRGVMTGIYGEGRTETISGWVRAAVAAAAVIVMILGAGVGNFIAKSSPSITSRQEEKIFNVEYLAAYPPDSVGDLLLAAIEGGEDEEE